MCWRRWGDKEAKSHLFVCCSRKAFFYEQQPTSKRLHLQGLQTADLGEITFFFFFVLLTLFAENETSSNLPGNATILRSDRRT